MMFIVFRSYDQFHIDRAQMNGLGAQVHVVEQGLYGPKISLAYDKDTKRVFWSDEGTGRIESMDSQGNLLSFFFYFSTLYLFLTIYIINLVSLFIIIFVGQNRKLFRTGITSPVSIAVLDTDIFWTSRRSNRLSWTDKKQVAPGIKGLNIGKYIVMIFKRVLFLFSTH